MLSRVNIKGKAVVRGNFMNDSVREIKPTVSKSLIIKGFTLIELLVVIAIISLLVSILLPSLKQAQEIAKQIKCASNQKNIGIAFAMYANSYDGWLPLTRTTMTYVDDDQIVQGIWANSLYNDGLDSLEVYECPCKEDSFFKPNVRNGGHKMAYGMEWYLGGGAGIGDGNRLSDIKYESLTVLVGEGVGPVNRYGVLPYAWGLPDETRHGGYSNILFTDGHVDKFTTDEAVAGQLIWY